MKQWINRYRSTPIADALKVAVSLEYYYLPKIVRISAANFSISSRMEA
jgi:hypothetical protein